ncbi:MULTISPECIES: acyl-CoA thioesterase [unclassified Cryobacterium]|uniref:acyl-CoA thioesterase n=2 Tax=Bacteria TaxID=2 RepID=UPI002AB4E5ED|nr:MULTISPECIES: acyl-CoA thioesterase [unclassified Cryobacterium]MDY7529591.1 acyl-CoA thioesterase [Cryobacterium sp. 10C2]MDY7558265.1 acyl-CoA thioesterase [Cryobacterium sp. 10C3]MEB0200815.1 acyl-CoA thioesterase [Cryobacterium sp. 5I3]MEB0290129.1 acyl-CoA thioesterase [Cryobacterium sp. 10C2]
MIRSPEHTEDASASATDSRDRITLRFMAVPQDTAADGITVAAGSVLEWIDKAAYACAVGWSASDTVTAYVGNVHFTRPIPPGSLVEVRARVIHTGRTSMHVLVAVDTANVRERTFTPATHCILVFVAIDEDGKPIPVPEWVATSAADRELEENAKARLALRRTIQNTMRSQEYTGVGTTPRTVFRFLAAPSAANWGGNAHGGTVMRWIDEAAFACAASWSSESAVAVYSGGIHFYRPIRIGHIVEVDARLIHTGPSSMHISIRVRSGSPRTPEDLKLTTQCMSIFVTLDSDGHSRAVAPLPLDTDEDLRLDAHARDLITLRAQLAPVPVEMMRQP